MTSANRRQNYADDDSMGGAHVFIAFSDEIRNNLRRMTDEQALLELWESSFGKNGITHTQKFSRDHI